MPTFSVIVPIYKVEKYLRQCVNSILAQSYANFELILVDDGSPDASPAICDMYAAQDARVKVIHKSNGGLVSARRAGAQIAQGTYVICVDGDDWVDERCLEHYHTIIQTHSPDVIASASVNAFEDQTKNCKNVLPYPVGYYSKNDLIHRIYPLLIQNERAKYFSPSVWAKAYRTALYREQQLAVSEQIKIGEDGACTIPCMYHAESLYVTDVVTYYYRQNPMSMTKEKKAFDWAGPELIHQHVQKQVDLSEFDFEQQLYRKTAHELFLVALSQFNRKESYLTIAKDIRNHLQSEIYAACIRKAKFKTWNGKLAVFALKYRVYRLIWLYAKLK